MKEMKGGLIMSKGRGVSSYTHNRQQLNDYANQHNPNNPAYWADQENRVQMDEHNRKDEKFEWPIPDCSYALDKDDW